MADYNNNTNSFGLYIGGARGARGGRGGRGSSRGRGAAYNQYTPQPQQEYAPPPHHQPQQPNYAANGLMMVPVKEYRDLIITVKNLVKRTDASEKVLGNIISSGGLKFTQMSLSQMRNEYSIFKGQLFNSLHSFIPEAVVQEERTAEVEPVSSCFICELRELKLS